VLMAPKIIVNMTSSAIAANMIWLKFIFFFLFLFFTIVCLYTRILSTIRATFCALFQVAFNALRQGRRDALDGGELVYAGLPQGFYGTKGF